MKELSIEEKAKAYDEALKVLHKYDGANIMFSQSLKEEMFPELKESEDERIRKCITLLVNGLTNEHFVRCGASLDEIKAWLEKQGENNKWKPSKDEMDALYGLAYITNKMDDKKDETITKLYQDLKREFFNGASYENMFPSSPVDAPIKDEKQGEQKPVDKVEPKFHEGNWVTNGIDFTFQVRSIEDDMYLRSDDYFIDIETADKTFRLWTIQDAKDGDVLCVKYGNDEMPFIFTGKQDDIAYCALNSFGEFVLSMVEWLLYTSVLPATKEQRDLLFQKMKEAGYEWDADKKELKKIEQKPAWSEEDENGFGDALWAIQQARTIAKDENDMGNLWCTERWLKSLKNRCIPQPKQEWSEEDKEIIRSLLDIIYECHSYGKCELKLDEYSKLCDWLKSLKDRALPQPKQEWSEDDERMLSLIVEYVHYDKSIYGKYKSINKALDWLKSLKERYTWKPSDEQLECLSYAIEKAEKDWSPLTNNRVYLTLKALEEQLKKLREE